MRRESTIECFRTVNEMCSLLILISSSCLPILSGSGQLRSSSLVISLSLMILLISSITKGLNLTTEWTKQQYYCVSMHQCKINVDSPTRTFLADHCIILVVGIVGIAKATIRSYLELQKLMAELAFVANVVSAVEVVRHFGIYTQNYCAFFDRRSACASMLIIRFSLYLRHNTDFLWKKRAVGVCTPVLMLLQ